MENINMTTAQEDIEDAIKFGWIEAQETTTTETTEEEQTMNNTKSYIIKCIQFHVDEDFRMIGNPIIREFSGLSLGEAKAAWMMARANNDMTKYSPLNVCDIIIPEEK